MALPAGCGLTSRLPPSHSLVLSLASERGSNRPRYSRAVEPIFFESPAAWRAWLEAHHDTASEFWLGMWKARTGRPTVTWAQAVREALCFGLIDGQAKRIDDESHMQRFSPRKSTRRSAINVALVQELEAAGLMHEAGRRAFAAARLARTLRQRRFGMHRHPGTARWPRSMAQAPSARRRGRSALRS